MKVFYDLSIHIFNWFISLATLCGHKKATLLSSGRKETIAKIVQFNSTHTNAVALFHCASLGEFEQARPVIEAWKVKYPSYKIVVSFYSPSGYEVRKKYSNADLIIYLTSDTKKDAYTFINTLNPSVVFIVKYEFWLNLLDAIKAKHIPLFLLSGVFRKKLFFFRKGGDFMRKRLHAFSHFFLQDKHSGELLSSIGFTNWSVSGDTRFDRVQQTALATIKIPEIETFKQEKPVFVIGSGWMEDMDVLIPFINNFTSPLKIIYAPHEIDDSAISAIEKQISKNTLRFSSYNSMDAITSDVLIIDNIGMLSSIYGYADFAYVGGAFGSGLHNILEPAVFGIPILFGPKIKKFPEASWLLSLGFAKSITSTETFTQEFNSLYHSPEIKAALQKGLQHTMLQSCGATNSIMQKLSSDFTQLNTSIQ